MININLAPILGQLAPILGQLADRLRKARLARNESQEVFAARIGLTRQTYSKMEKGVPSIPLGYWLAASEIVDRLETWKNVLAEKDDLFAQFENERLKRQRASRKQGK